MLGPDDTCRVVLLRRGNQWSGRRSQLTFGLNMVLSMPTRYGCAPMSGSRRQHTWNLYFRLTGGRRTPLWGRRRRRRRRLNLFSGGISDDFRLLHPLHLRSVFRDNRRGLGGRSGGLGAGGHRWRFGLSDLGSNVDLLLAKVPTFGGNRFRELRPSQQSPEHNG